jgi:hypothetical protein
MLLRLCDYTIKSPLAVKSPIRIVGRGAAHVAHVVNVACYVLQHLSAGALPPVDFSIEAHDAVAQVVDEHYPRLGRHFGELLLDRRDSDEGGDKRNEAGDERLIVTE